MFSVVDVAGPVVRVVEFVGGEVELIKGEVVVDVVDDVVEVGVVVMEVVVTTTEVVVAVVVDSLDSSSLHSPWVGSLSNDFRTRM